jgi:hypothetical protein
MFGAVDLPSLSALVNRVVRTRRRAKAAIDALFGNQRRHTQKPGDRAFKASASVDATYPVP